MSAERLAEAASRIAAAQKVLLTCHRGPDGDSVGSMVALAALLRARNVPATIYNPDLVPRRLKWLPQAKTLTRRLRKETRYDLTVVVDCGDRKLLGDSFPPAEVTGDLVVLDHHASVVPFGEVYVCDPEAASVGVLVARIAAHNGWSLDRDAALGIYVSMISDTGSFRYSNTNREAFLLAADLVAIGVDPGRVAERMNERVPFARYKLLSAALATLELAADGLICFMTVTHEMVRDAGATWEHSEGLVNYARAIDGVDCGVLITPAKRGGTRVSLRSKGKHIDAGAVCSTLGGGGHVGAAGCTLESDLPTARKQVEEALLASLRSGQAE